MLPSTGVLQLGRLRFYSTGLITSSLIDASLGTKFIPVPCTLVLLASNNFFVGLFLSRCGGLRLRGPPTVPHSRSSGGTRPLGGLEAGL